MSAYIVDHGHIDALLSFAIKHKVVYFAGNARVEVTDANATEIGRILLDENERSVRYRYPDCEGDDLPGTIGEDSASYTFRSWPRAMATLTVLKACDGFDYQACETENYKTSLAHTIVDTIRQYAIVRLPGYDNAPGWSLTRTAA